MLRNPMLVCRHMKKCRWCKKEKPYSDFFRDSSRSDGFQYLCKPCSYEQYRDKRKRNPSTYRKKDLAYYKKNFKKIKARREVYYRNNRHKILAQNAVKTALFKGEITRPENCACGNKKPQAHHDDYSKALEVRWLCRSCHMLWHKMNG